MIWPNPSFYQNYFSFLRQKVDKHFYQKSSGDCIFWRKFFSDGDFPENLNFEEIRPKNVFKLQNKFFER